MKNWRLTTLFIFFCLAYLFLIYKLYDIQIVKNAVYSAKAENQEARSGLSEPSRGSIYFTDRNNNINPAVINKEFPIIYAVPKEIKDYKEAAMTLSQIFDFTIPELEKKLNNPKDLYKLLSFKATDNQIESVKNIGLEGIYQKNQLGRYYPFGNLASHVLGFVSPFDSNDVKSVGQPALATPKALPAGQRGRYGLESFFDKELSGVAKNSEGKVSDGKSFVLTIDQNVQAQSEEILKNLISSWSAESGTVIVQDPITGKILAMASQPDFDPNNYSKFNVKNFLNPAVQAIYEPGSVFKIFTMAAGIDSGKITPETTYTDTGSVVINGRKIENWDLKAHGVQTMTGVIEQSINTGTVFAEKQIGHQLFYDYLVKFGFDQTTGIKLPGEIKGKFSHLKKGKDVDFATVSYGQGVAVTPIELISAVSAIANGGVLMKPIILNSDNPEVLRRVISQDTAFKVTGMMVSAVKKNVLADIPNYKIAGKTGTAFIPDFKYGGYTDNVINSCVGFAPASNPKFVVLIKLDKPKNAPLAGQTVVPAFRQLAEFLLNYYNIAPDNM